MKKNYKVSFYNYGSITVKASSEKMATWVAMERAKKIFKPEIFEELEVAAVEKIA
jgi:hypothetical protein